MKPVVTQPLGFNVLETSTFYCNDGWADSVDKKIYEKSAKRDSPLEKGKEIYLSLLRFPQFGDIFFFFFSIRESSDQTIKLH